MWSANEAAKNAGISKTTLLRHIENGKLSAGRNEKGHWEIDPSEVARVYGGGPSGPDHGPVHGAPRAGPGGPGGPPNVPPEINVLQIKLDASEKLAAEREAELHHRDVTIEHLRGELDEEKRERREAQTKLTALLSDMRPTAPEKPVGRHRAHWGYWVALTLVVVALGAVGAYLGFFPTVQ